MNTSIKELKGKYPAIEFALVRDAYEKIRIAQAAGTKIITELGSREAFAYQAAFTIAAMADMK